jgi:RNA polymerase sigma-70 factor, ECF subfamily
MAGKEGNREGEFEEINADRGLIEAYCRRRGSRDPEGVTAEVMSIAWAQREKIDPKRARPWLIITARNLLLEEYRARARSFPMDPGTIAEVDPRTEPDFEVESLDPAIGRALDSLSPDDREAVLLVAWEELSPAEAARSMNLRAATFRVRLHRARRRLREALEQSTNEANGTTDRPIQENA